MFRKGYDKYGRDLVGRAIGGRDMAQIMVGEGLAVAYKGPARRN